MTRKPAAGAAVPQGRDRRRVDGSSSCTCASTATAPASGPTAAVRRYVRDAGPLLARLHKLTRADCTTRNTRKAAALARTYDDLEERIARLGEEEELAAIRPDLDGNEIMAILGMPAGGRWWARPTGSCSSCASTAARSAGRRRWPSCARWWADQARVPLTRRRPR